MCFNVKHKDLVLYLCNQPVNLVEHETNLGNDIVSDIFDRSISHTVHTFYKKSNHVISYFRMLYSFNFHILHSTYCMRLYFRIVCGMEKSNTKDFQITNENA